MPLQIGVLMYLNLGERRLETLKKDRWCLLHRIKLWHQLFRLELMEVGLKLVGLKIVA